MMEMLDIVKQNPVLAILRNVPLSQTVQYAGAVVQGGVRFFEVALNSPAALQQITLLRETFGDDVLVGAGTAVTVEQAKAALNAGAQFLLAPSSPAAVLQYCAQHDVPFLPGVFTPTEVQLCLEWGFSVLKLFPAGDLPLRYVKDLQGPYPQTQYVAIGGVTPQNATQFLRAGCAGVGMGSGLLPKQSLQQGDWAACSASIQQLVSEIKAVKQELAE